MRISWELIVSGESSRFSGKAGFSSGNDLVDAGRGWCGRYDLFVMKSMRFLLIVFFLLSGEVGYGQGSAPTFRYNANHHLVTLPGRDPAQGGTTVIPTVLVPVRLEFPARSASDAPWSLNAAKDVPRVLNSPVFSKGAFGAEEKTQYADAMLHATTGAAAGWHTLLEQPKVQPVMVRIPPGYGYMLTSKRTGTLLGMADAEYVQRAIFQQIPRQE